MVGNIIPISAVIYFDLIIKSFHHHLKFGVIFNACFNACFNLIKNFFLLKSVEHSNNIFECEYRPKQQHRKILNTIVYTDKLFVFEKI